MTDNLKKMALAAAQVERMNDGSTNISFSQNSNEPPTFAEISPVGTEQALRCVPTDSSISTAKPLSALVPVSPPTGELNDTQRIVHKSDTASREVPSTPNIAAPHELSVSSPPLPSSFHTIETRNTVTTPITEVNENDVLCGRGGETNHHTGNVRYRQLVKKHQRSYLRARRRDKPSIARLIVDAVRNSDPPGRFLKKKDCGKWFDVGDKKAREKTSQALREGAPDLRKGEEQYAAATGAVSSSLGAGGHGLYPTTTVMTTEPLVTGHAPAIISPNQRKKDRIEWRHHSQEQLPFQHQTQNHLHQPTSSFPNENCKKRKLQSETAITPMVSPAPPPLPLTSSGSVSLPQSSPQTKTEAAPPQHLRQPRLSKPSSPSPTEVGGKIRGPRLRILKARMSDPSFLSMPCV